MKGCEFGFVSMYWNMLVRNAYRTGKIVNRAMMINAGNTEPYGYHFLKICPELLRCAG
jgi:hypothetical protein